jgi:hypothetical protein
VQYSEQRCGGPEVEGINGDTTIRVDILSLDGRFVTAADCRPAARSEEGSWGGLLTGIEPHKHLPSGRYRMRIRGGTESHIHVHGRQRIGSLERYPFTGEGVRPAFVAMG